MLLIFKKHKYMQINRLNSTHEKIKQTLYSSVSLFVDSCAGGDILLSFQVVFFTREIMVNKRGVT